MRLHDLHPRENPPTIGAAIAVLGERLIAWGAAGVPDSVPQDVVHAAYVVAVLLVVAGVGRLTQRWTIPTDWIDAETVLRMREASRGQHG